MAEARATDDQSKFLMWARYREIHLAPAGPGA